jgi:hypothetical protein
MFEAARKGNSDLLLAAIEAGLPVNLTNDKGFSDCNGPRNVDWNNL